MILCRKDRFRESRAFLISPEFSEGRATLNRKKYRNRFQSAGLFLKYLVNGTGYRGDTLPDTV